jgi:pterin-4a-carbinolamine dehydratase
MLKSLKIARPLAQMSSVRSYTRVKKLDGEARETALKQIPTWTTATEKDAIQKNYKFKDFKQAFAFMTKVAEKAEEVGFTLDH